MRKAVILLLFILTLSPVLAHAQAGQPPPGNGSSNNPNTPFNYGQDAENKGLDWVGKDILGGIMAAVQSFSLNNAFIKVLDWIANIFVLMMKFFWTLVGSILIRNIDFTSVQSFTGDQVNPSANKGFQTVNNLYVLFVSVGVCLSLSLFFLHIGQNAIGLGKMEIKARTLIRLMVALTVLIFIPYFTSFMALWTNSLSQLIYQQNLMSMNGALDGISKLSASNFSQDVPVQPSTTPANPTDKDSFGNVHNGILQLLSYSYYFAFVGAIIGMMIGSYKISTSDKNGFSIFKGALIALVCVILAYAVTRYFFSAGRSIFGINQNQISSVQAYNGNNFTLPMAQPDPSLNTSSSGFWGGVQNIFNSVASEEANTGLMLLAVIAKVFISIFGCWIILKVFFGKVFQILTLAALFILSPLIAACLAHPATENIAHTGLKYIIKYYLYSVVWAIALVFMFIITSINFGFSSMGAQNFETALAMLGGLIFLEKVEGLVGLLTGTGGPSVEGAMKDFGQFSSTMIGAATAAFGGAAGAIAGAKASMGEGFGGHHMAGAVAGGAMGFLAPVLGAGKTASMGANAGIKLATAMQGYFSGGSGGGTTPSNPYSASGSTAHDPNPGLANSLQQLSSTLQARSMPKRPSGPPPGQVV